ncbi:vacuolar protein sorting-associated protein 9A [Vigna radiata var. radiata]|uniref:Vacuolar protein sorting-associated protein 9A n=1 Tax=Vigna radiata var. radiata TaxID=3916 RepID=A0A1S3U1W3_VIGRR|nr:vacuolar protein sorting-associated protein 9A [Vigna radiata var. radiata]
MLPLPLFHFQSLLNLDYSININNMNTETTAESRSTTPFTDFLNRMHHPASLDLVRSIKSFIVSFSFYQPKPENDGKKVQDFFLSMEAAMRDHPLWTTASEEDIDCAMEGLEKYIMIKLFSRTFSATPEDAKIDYEISEKISLLQTFLKPEHLDIPPIHQIEASLMLAEKELLKINAFKAPHEKLLSILNCCRVINNVLLNVAMSEHVPAGADDFLPMLIYVTIKANPPKLHSNLKFIKLFRRQAKLVSEAEYYFTNLVSATSFIVDLNAKSLSMDETKFEESMQAAKLINKVSNESSSTCQMSQQQNNECSCSEKMPHKPDATGVQVLQHGSNYPYMEAKSRGLTVGDVDVLLSDYKDLVSKYTILCKAISCLSTSEREPLLREIEKQSAGTLLSHHAEINTATHQHN